MNAATLKNTLHLLNADQIVDFNLADLVLDGRRVFNMGVTPRAEMPQLKGFPRSGSVAKLLPPDRNGKVDVSDLFLNWVANVKDIEVRTGTMSPRHMSGSQCELIASKVARHALKMLDNPSHKKFRQTYLIDKHNTLIDGHHGWASARCWELMVEREVKLEFVRLMVDADSALKLATEFTGVLGVMSKEGL